MAEAVAETERLILRDWRESDLDALHHINSDPLVMATIGPVQDRESTRAGLGRLMARAVNDGHTFWALERKGDTRMIGFCGVARGTVPQIAEDIEIGWRLASDCWGQSYAREAAEAVHVPIAHRGAEAAPAFLLPHGFGTEEALHSGLAHDRVIGAEILPPPGP